jgi:hypothetical protein
MTQHFFRIFFTGSLILLLAGCMPASDPATPALSSRIALTGLDDLLSDQGLELVADTEVQGDNGYLTLFPGKFSSGINAVGERIGPFPKYALILTGTPYNMGYQAATLRSAEGYRMLTDFMKRVCLQQFASLGLHLPQEGPLSDELYRLIYGAILDVVGLMEKDLPDNLRQEMRGFADGMNAAGYHNDPYSGMAISYQHLLVINEAIDSTFFFLGAVLGYAKETPENRAVIASCRKTFLTILAKTSDSQNTLAESDEVLLARVRQHYQNTGELLRFGCNELVVAGKATASGETYHGRDFMFSTADTYQDVASLVVYLPDQGYPFLTVSVPGFIGQSVGINIKGLSMGQDVCMLEFIGSTPGVGSMLMIRDVLQNSASLAQAIERLRTTPRGIPWVFAVATASPDSRYGYAAELEVLTNQRPNDVKDGFNTLPLWLQAKYSREIRLLNKLDKEDLTRTGNIDRGVLVRGATWAYPSDESFLSPRLDPQDYPSYTAFYNEGYHFTEQIENQPDVLAATNHFIRPRMRMLQFAPLISTIYGSTSALAESVWRYENIITNITNYYGRIDFFGTNPDSPELGSAGWLIDFLNTQRDYPWFYRDPARQGNYTRPVDTWVDGHHAVMNNSQREIRALFGYMTDPWVGLRLQPFVDWYYGSSATFE